MTSPDRATKIAQQIIHHLYAAEGALAVCGHLPGPDVAGRWHTHHGAAVLLAYARAGAACCLRCCETAEKPGDSL